MSKPTLTIASVKEAIRTASAKEFAHLPGRAAEIAFWKRQLATLGQTRNETR